MGWKTEIVLLGLIGGLVWQGGLLEGVQVAPETPTPPQAGAGEGAGGDTGVSAADTPTTATTTEPTPTATTRVPFTTRTPRPDPDYVIEQFSCLPNAGFFSDDVVVTCDVTVVNAGEARGETRVAVELVGPITPGPGADTEISLRPGETTRVSLEFEVPPSIVEAYEGGRVTAEVGNAFGDGDSEEFTVYWR